MAENMPTPEQDAEIENSFGIPAGKKYAVAGPDGLIHYFEDRADLDSYLQSSREK